MELESTIKQTYDYSIRLLSKRDYSIYKLTQKLLARNFPQEHIDEVILELIEKKFLQEEQYKRARIKQLVEKGLANDYIVKKMEQEYLPVESMDIEIIREDLNLSSSKQLNSLIEKKLRSKVIPTQLEAKLKLKQKITSYLSTKGYPYDEINQQLEEIFK